MNTNLNKNWIELNPAPYPYSTNSRVKCTYVMLKKIDQLWIMKDKDGDDKELYHILALAQGTKYLYETKKEYAEAEQTARDLIALVEDPDSQNNKSQKKKLHLVSGGKK